MSEAPVADALDLMAFCAKEFQTFFGLLKHALNQYQADGQLPETVFRQGAAPHLAAQNSGDTKTKGKRRPTAFNMFVKEKMEEFKAAGFKLEDDKNGNQLFALAVDHWKKLTETQKQQYIKQYKAGGQASGDVEPDSTIAAPDFDTSQGPIPIPPVSPVLPADDIQLTDLSDKKRKAEDLDEPLFPVVDGSSPAKVMDAADGEDVILLSKKQKDK